MADLNAISLPKLFDALDGERAAHRVAVAARDEDLGPGGRPGDLTGLIASPAGDRARARLRARQAGVAAGLACLPAFVPVFSRRIRARTLMRDGAAFQAGQDLCELSGSARDILALERSLLNLLSRLCGVATVTRRYLKAMNASGPVRARLLDTRKTTPGLRVLEKYAVRCGGGFCHRVGLYDAVLIKDNHIAHVPIWELKGWTERAAAKARSLNPSFVEIEVDSLEQLGEVLIARLGRNPAVDIVLLDNMTPGVMKKAVAMRDALAPGVLLEASGGIDLSTIARAARSGVDRISVGALTHSAPIIDLGLDFL
ncbi:MAG: carboxylating nicotinate-nucleotide diphosphorylase [Phycisphaerales bacterium]|nr:carboxylating nicotinate-nucleotide diphosphorylase [Planctomycetota bacterium]